MLYSIGIKTELFPPDPTSPWVKTVERRAPLDFHDRLVHELDILKTAKRKRDDFPTRPDPENCDTECWHSWLAKTFTKRHRTNENYRPTFPLEEAADNLKTTKRKRDDFPTRPDQENCDTECWNAWLAKTYTKRPRSKINYKPTLSFEELARILEAAPLK